MKFITLFLVIFISLFIIDMLWLSLIAKNLYSQHLGMLMRKSPIWWPVLIIYFCMTLGIILGVLPKANGDYFAALLWGGLLGFIIYGIYDFTNYATLANWPLKISLIDWFWGTFLCALTSLFATFIQNRFSLNY